MVLEPLTIHYGEPTLKVQRLPRSGTKGYYSGRKKPEVKILVEIL